MSLSMLKKGLLRLLLLLLLYFLQADVFPHLRVLGACPLLLPLLAVGFGLYEGGLVGGLWGLAAGVLCDLSVDGTFAFTVLLCCAGFLAGFLGEFIMARGFLSLLLLAAGTELCAVLIQALPLLNAAEPMQLLPAMGVQFLYSLLFAFPVSRACRGISRIKA